MMQSEQDAVHISKIGAPAEKILVAGNLKFDCDYIEMDSDKAPAQSLEEDLGTIAANDPLIVAGSTHEGEEQILFDVLQLLRNTPALERTRLLLAPRHPERFDAVAQLAVRNGLAVARRTDRFGHGQEAPVLLLDTVGELAAIYRFATIVFIGGTLVRHGGHSIMEPALYSKAIVTGPSMQNFRQIFDEFRLHKGICAIEAGEEDPKLQGRQLLDVFRRLLQNGQERDALGSAARSILERNRGATRNIGERIADIFEERMSGDGKNKG
jgi:3-deoxy-D-manno-octulosonic-acid transferase